MTAYVRKSQDGGAWIASRRFGRCVRWGAFHQWPDALAAANRLARLPVDDPSAVAWLTCQHGNASGACPECRNGVDPTTGDVA